jgi:hypothetical protein
MKEMPRNDRRERDQISWRQLSKEQLKNAGVDIPASD